LTYPSFAIIGSTRGATDDMPSIIFLLDSISLIARRMPRSSNRDESRTLKLATVCDIYSTPHRPLKNRSIPLPSVMLTFGFFGGMKSSAFICRLMCGFTAADAMMPVCNQSSPHGSNL
jgi:hypothetical protein